MRISRNALLRATLGIAISVIAIVILINSVDIEAALQVLRTASPAWIAVMFVTAIIDIGARGGRWRALLEPIAPLPYSRVLGYTYIGYLANNVLPARLGELYRSHALGEGEGISRPTVLGTVVVERVVDTVMVVAIAAIAVLVLSVRGVMTSAVLLGLAFVALLVIALGLGIVAHRLPGADRVIAIIARRPRLLELARRLRDGLAVAQRPRVIVVALAFSAVAWTASTATFLVAGQAVGVELSVAQAALHHQRRGARLDRPVRSRLRRHVRADRRGHRRRARHPARSGVRARLTGPRRGPAGHLGRWRDRDARPAPPARGRSRIGRRGPGEQARAVTEVGSFPNVLAPLTLRHRTLRSRINFGAHTTNMSEEGLPGKRHIGYYRERALGGVGMIVVEPVPVHRTGVLTRGNFRHGDDAIIPAFRRLTDACREANPDIVMIHQLYHLGQHNDADNSFAPNWSPSGLPSYHDADGSHAMTEAEIEELIAGFVAAAGRAQASGFDGIEIFAGYNGAVDQFWTTWTNRRTDRWGGSFENRMRFSSEILRRIRERCGDDFIIGMGVSADPDSPAMLSVEELARTVGWHDERRLMDYVSCGTGSYFDFFKIIPPSLFPQRLGEPYAAALKAVCRNALVQAESHIRTPAAAEAVLAAGHADMVSIVRGQIADPHLVAKTRAGRADEVRPCISCNQLCWGRRSRDYWISCLVNPSAGREWEWDGDRFEPAATPQARPGRRRRSGRAGGGSCRGGTGPSRDAHGARAGARRPVPSGRAPAVARPDHGPHRLVRPAAGKPWAWMSGWASRRAQRT